MWSFSWSGDPLSSLDDKHRGMANHGNPHMIRCRSRRTIKPAQSYPSCDGNIYLDDPRWLAEICTECWYIFSTMHLASILWVSPIRSWNCHGFMMWRYLRGFPEMAGTPNSSILMGCSLINQPFWGTPHLGKPPYIPKLYHCWIESSTEYHFWFTTVTSESKQCRMVPHGSDTTARLSRLCSAAVTDKMMTRGADWRSGLSGWWMARYGK